MIIKFPQKILERVRKHLERQKRKVKKQLSSLSKEDPFSDPDRLIDNAASDTEAKEEVGHERIQAIKGALKNTLDKIEKALLKVKKRTYGHCEVCKKLIDTDRLAANPTATLCMECERKRAKVRK